MKKIIILLSLFIFSQVAIAQITLFSEDFELGVNAVLSQPQCTDNSTDFFVRTDGSTGVSGNYSVTGKGGMYFFAAQDLDGPPCVEPESTMIFEDINISNFSNLILSFRAAEDDDGVSQDWDGHLTNPSTVFDYFAVEVDIDNSGSFTRIFQFSPTGSPNSFNLEPSVDANFDNEGDGTTFLTSTFANFSANIIGTGSLLDIKLIFAFNAVDEDIAIDDIKLTGDDVTLGIGSLENPLQEVKVFTESGRFVTSDASLKIEVYTILGQKVVNQNLSQGVYILKISNQTGQSFVLKKVI